MNLSDRIAIPSYIVNALDDVVNRLPDELQGTARDALLDGFILKLRGEDSAISKLPDGRELHTSWTHRDIEGRTFWLCSVLVVSQAVRGVAIER